MINKYFLIILIFIASNAKIHAQEIYIIPLPKQIENGIGYFILNDATIIYYNDQQLHSLVNRFLNSVESLTGLHFSSRKVNECQKKDQAINLFLVSDDSIPYEGYELQINANSITLQATSLQGLFYGLQSFLQIIPENREYRIPCVTIKDAPRFQWRGFMLDVSRHFFSIEELKTLIDQMALYKYNVFHLHLTDDQGWRIEINAFPRLTEVGAWRVPRIGSWNELQVAQIGEKASYGGYYTKKEIMDLIQYAGERFIQIMPEIDIPGHSMAAITSYPHLSCTKKQYQVPVNSSFYGSECNTLCIGNDSTFDFVDKVLDEIVAMFPFKYVHIGGDECYKEFWKKCPDCQDLMKKNDLENEKELQSYFVKQVEKMLLEKGRKLVGWGEILEGGLAPNSTVMSWIDMTAGNNTARQGHDVIMTPRFPTYMDYYQGDFSVEPLAGKRVNRLKTCYSFDPAPNDKFISHIIGGETCLWTENIPNFRHAQYMYWPRSMALAEVYWSPNSKKNWEGFIYRMEHHMKKFDKLDYKYALSYLDAVVKPFIGRNGILYIQLGKEKKGLDIYYTFDNTFPDKYSAKYLDGQVLEIPKNAKTIIVATYENNKQIGKTISIPLNELKTRTQIKKVQGYLEFQ
ncbi:family 20 glycosylhydrolase [Maribellus comscasis]|uniref:beta-N-acetylhexosaminidase n=1 Tax=Maribellus comscasis TaxID=2681766 RepID=A0A6I6K2W5_9BACT|nr:family 20 glycosylhydrolase [Maribellus comscasis]QGY47788.1 family 20 glycosylhydrolase [Maribellus comscasis]